MEIISRPFNGENYWRKKGYTLLNGAAPRRKIRVVQVTGGSEGRRRKKRFWRLRKPLTVLVKKMTLKKLWRKFKEEYVNFMMRLSGEFAGRSEFMRKRIDPDKGGINDFERRLVLEIYRSLATSRGVSEF